MQQQNIHQNGGIRQFVAEQRGFLQRLERQQFYNNQAKKVHIDSDISYKFAQQSMTLIGSPQKSPQEIKEAFQASIIASSNSINQRMYHSILVSKNFSRRIRIIQQLTLSNQNENYQNQILPKTFQQAQKQARQQIQKIKAVKQIDHQSVFEQLIKFQINNNQDPDWDNQERQLRQAFDRDRFKIGDAANLLDCYKNQINESTTFSKQIKQNFKQLFRQIESNGVKGFLNKIFEIAGNLFKIIWRRLKNFGSICVNSIKQLLKFVNNINLSQQQQYTNEAKLKFFLVWFHQSILKRILHKIKKQPEILYKTHQQQSQHVIKYEIPYQTQIPYKYGQSKELQSNKMKIGLIGDFGTGLRDSINLLRDMIIHKGVSIIIHLGDIYYAGGKQQYQKSITIPLNQIRNQVKREILFYCIPGNHDYYSLGYQFHAFIQKINKHGFAPFVNDPNPHPTKTQNASYFCLRDNKHKWQFLGIDTAYSEAKSFFQVNQVLPFHNGPQITEEQLLWHKDKIKNFKGSTILLSHHQLFSIHDRIAGKWSQARMFSNLNPILMSNLFSQSPFVSAWFWGHEHSIMFFEKNVLGIQKARLLGNSSYHEFSNQDPYSINYKFPKIPRISSIKQNLLINSKTGSSYCNLSYAVIQMTDDQAGLPIYYYTAPAYINSDQNLHRDGSKYLLHDEKLQTINSIKAKSKTIKQKMDEQLFLLSQIGLMVFQYKGLVLLNKYGTPLSLQPIVHANNTEKVDEEISSEGFYICAKVENNLLYLSSHQNKVIWISQLQRNSMLSIQNCQ